MTFADIERVINVDFWGVVNGTKAFLPHLIDSGEGTLVNISSLFGLVPMPSQSAYVAAKYAVRGFTESVRMEMLIGRYPVRVTCVHPGGVKTAIARNGDVERRRRPGREFRSVRQSPRQDVAGTGRRGHSAGRSPRPAAGAHRAGRKGRRRSRNW